MYVLWREEEWWKWVSEREKESKRERNKKERVWERKQKKPWMKERVRECEWEWEREREREMFCDWKEGGVFSLLGLYGIVCFFKRSLQWLNTKGSSHHLVTSGSCQPFPIIFYFVNRNLDPTFICLHSFESLPKKLKSWPSGHPQGCQMAYFKSKIPIFGKLWMVLKWKVYVYFMALWSVKRPFGIFYCHRYITGSYRIFFPVLVCCTYEEKSGNTGHP
jgi:hypothetical protein